MITAVIAETDMLHRATLRRRLAAHCPQISIVGEAKDAAETLAMVLRLQPGLLFLDTDMPALPGYSLFALTQDRSLEIILMTEREQVAAGVEPVWLVKPFGVNDLTAAVRAALNKKKPGLPADSEINPGQDRNPVQRLALPSLNGLQFLDVRDIVYLEANSNYTTFYLTSRSTMLVSKSLKEFEDKLPQAFIRIHHSCIVNKNLVSRYIRGEGGQVEMKNGTLLTVARRKKDEFLREMALG